MKKNMGSADRAIRLILAVILIYLAYMGILTSPFDILGYVLAAVFTLTSFISFCPLYTLVGLSTCKR